MTETMSSALHKSELVGDSGTTRAGGLQQRPVKLLGLIAGLLAAIGALMLDGELELTLFMATAVICSLACFDAALDRRIDAFWPWMLISVAILAKTLPTVVSRLSDHIGPDAERFDHVGAVLAGLCIAVVVFMLARPPAGAEQRNPIAGIVVLCGLAGAAAGASVAFAGAAGMGSRRAARIFETLGWGTAAAILAGAAIAIGGTRRLTTPMLAVVVGTLGVGVLAARTASGSAVDLGWWALAYFAMAVGSLGFARASLGRRTGRRATLVPAVVAVVSAVLCVQAMILALGDSGTWGPGVVVLPLLALALLGLGLLLYRWGGTGADEVDEESAAVFEMIADSGIEHDSARSAESDPLPDVPPPDGPVLDNAVPDAPEPQPARVASAAVDQGVVERPTASAFSGAIAPSQPAPSQPAPSQPAAASADPAAATVPTEPPPPPQQPVETVPPSPPAPPAPAPPVPAPAEAVPVVAASTSTEGLEPHLVDPTTGLRSVAGLQAVLVDAFAGPRAAGEVSIVMVALRNLGTVEQTHGRVAAARVTAELAHRFSTRLPDAYTARFASDAFAAVIDGASLDVHALIPRCADVLSELLEPVAIGDAAVEIDVAASMAQCYANEDIAGFIGRANTGLERAVAATEPSLVAMP